MRAIRRAFLSLLPFMCSVIGSGQTFQPVSTAKISPANGVPRLLINGVPTPPLIFFWNDEIGGPALPFLVPQVKAAASNGVHIFSTPVHWPWLGSDPGVPLNWSNTDLELQRFIDLDPQAVFVVRMRSEPPGNWSGWSAAPPGDIIRYQSGSVDGSGTRLSWGSQYLRDNSIATFAISYHMNQAHWGNEL
jgi:hypothetical protein